MTYITYLVYSFKAIFKGAIAATIAMVGAIIGHFFSFIYGYDYGYNQAFYDSHYGLFLFFLVSIVMAVSIGELFKKLSQPFLERFLSILAYHYFFFHGLRLFERFMFHSQSTNMLYEIIFSVSIAIIFSLAIALLWKPEETNQTLLIKVKKYMKNDENNTWFLRYLFGSVIFVPIYAFSSWLIRPFIEPYKIQTGLNVFSVYDYSFIVFLLFIIGCLFAFFVLPIFILWNSSKSAILYWLGFPVFIQTALYPAIIEYWLPMGVRFPYLIQYTVIAFLIAIIYVQLFYVPKEHEVIDDQFKWLY